MKIIRKYHIHYLLAAGLLYLFSVYAYKQYNKAPDLAKAGKKIELQILERLSEMDRDLADAGIPDSLLNGHLSESAIKMWMDKPFVYGFFVGDSLIWWNKYQTDIPPVLRFARRHEPLTRLNNAYYKVRAVEHHINGLHTYAVGLLPVRYAYQVENRYLHNELNFEDIPEGLHFSLTTPLEANQSVRIRGPEGETLFYIYSNGEEGPSRVPPIALLTLMGAFFLLLGSAWHLVLSPLLPQKVPNTLRWILFVLLSYAIRLVFLPDFANNSVLFSPGVYASAAWAPSLGHLLLNVVVFGVAIYFFCRKVNLRQPQNGSLRFIQQSVLLASVFLLHLAFYLFLQTLIFDSKLHFNLTQFLQIGAYGWIAVLMAGVFMSAVLLFSLKIMKWADRQPGDRQRFLLSLLLALIIFLPFVVYLPTVYPVLLIVLPAFFLLLIIQYLPGPERRLPPVYQFLLALLYTSVLTGILLNVFNDRKERESERLFANLLLQPDYLTEYLFAEVRDEIGSDPLVIGYFKGEEGISDKDLEDEVNYVYLKGELSKYDVQVFAFAEDSLSLAGELKKYYLMIDREGQATTVPGLYYFPASPGRVEYLAILRIYDSPEGTADARLLGRLLIAFRLKSIGGSTVYPELLLNNENMPAERHVSYDYAVYRNGMLVKKKGDFPYPVRFSSEEQVNGRQSHSEYEHQIYTDTPEKVIWLSRKKRSGTAIFSLISILFFLYSLAFLILLAAYHLLRDPKAFRDMLLLKNASFAVRIQLAVMGVILLSFIIIAAVVIHNIRNEYDQYHRQRLMRKAQQILSNLEYLKSRSEVKDLSWDAFINSGKLRVALSNLSEVHAMDFNLYRKDGTLAESSQPAVFKRGILSHLMHPMSRFEMYDKLYSQFLQSEQIGELQFIAAYMPLLDAENRVAGALNVPYFAKERNLDEQIASFLIYFINIYIILLAMAAILGFLISNSISRPIIQLGHRIRQIQLGGRNIPLQWKRQDEIGRLIEEYNTMIGELEESARKLAQTERESAWREMARQVAHEIKNPLTPMKLSIQHLQRTAAGMSGSEGQRVYRVCETLLEQIDHLNVIASEFSSFAQMPEAQNKEVNIIRVLKSVVELYAGGRVAVSLSSDMSEYLVFADEKQLNRVFQNLIKNAVESIPEEREGRVDVRVGTRAAEGRQWVEVQICDNGVGMSEEVQKEIFRPNFTTKSTGSGLGLPISQRIIRNAGGDIRVESKEGEGSCFYLTLPLLERRTPLT